MAICRRSRHYSTRLELLELHATALFVHDARGRITAINEPDGARPPRYFCTRALDGTALWRFRDDVAEGEPPPLAELHADGPHVGDPPPKESPILASRGRASDRWSSGPAYAFPEVLPPAPSHVHELGANAFELVRGLGWTAEEFPRDFAVRAPFFAVLGGGVAISLCFTARLAPRAAEAGVATLAAHRGRGHALAVVTAWAHATRAAGRMPLYSTSWENTASQAVARKLGLVHYASDFSLR